LNLTKIIQSLIAQLESFKKAFANLQLELLNKDETISSLTKSKAELLAEIETLRNNQKKNSSNSSKPPSSDFAKPLQTKSLREKTGKKVGGQTGHKGTSLEFSTAPTQTLIHKVNVCNGCGDSLAKVAAQDFERRQVFDIPPIEIIVTEHQCEIKGCPNCGLQNKGIFPEHVNQPVQYGNVIQSLAVYFTQGQLLPYQRTSEIFKALFNIKLSTSFLVNNNKRFAKNLIPFIDNLKVLLLQASVLHADETGFKVDGKTYWLHTHCTDEYTFYDVHEKRGKEAMDAIGILSLYKGVLVHDFWKPYNTFDCKHQLCNVHHLRDLTFCHEVEGSEIAESLMYLLLDLNLKVKEAKEAGNETLTKGQIQYWNKKFNDLILEGFNKHPIAHKAEVKQGVSKKNKTQNMLLRFKDYKESILGFIKNFNIPFGNNIAEQAIRMMKVKIKISGCFRSMQGAKDFAYTRSYLATMKKQNQPILFAIASVINGKPIIIT
jgi:transposase